MVVDKHQLVRQALAALMEKSKQVSKAYTAPDASSALAVIKENKVDMVVVNAYLPTMDTISFLHHLHEEHPATKLIGITSADERERLAALIHGKAQGILLKHTASLEEIDHCIREVMAGEIYFAEPVKQLLQHMDHDSKEPFTGFTPCEMDILRLVCTGQVTKEIAQLLNLKGTSVEDYRKSMLKKTHSKNVAELVAFALRNGFL